MPTPRPYRTREVASPLRANLRMTESEAESIVLDGASLLAERDYRDRAIPGTSRVDMIRNGQGWDVRLPAEDFGKLLKIVFAADPQLLDMVYGGREGLREELFDTGCDEGSAKRTKGW